MKLHTAVVSAVMFAISAWAQTPAPAPAPPAAGKNPIRVATIHIQNAIIQTKEGQKAASDLQAKYLPRRQELEKKQSDITAIQNQMRTGSATMSDAAKAKLQRDYDTNSKEFKRNADDFEAEVQQEENKIMNGLGQKLMDVVIKYATQNSIAVVVDVSSQSSNVLWADPAIDITNEVIKLYDQAHPSAGAPPAPAPAKPPAAPPAKK
ncbi:MAG TPA: OmpH family outer membrane protein [Bryobacteraceae bacterium]|nr:OmpH family outer membrane protein [Bryobacteraceae bacterium]